VSPPVHENQLSKSNKLDAEAIWLFANLQIIKKVLCTALFGFLSANPYLGPSIDKTVLTANMHYYDSFASA
jgi:hypothetical protein